MSLTFHADHYFAIGHAHLCSGKPCQDHALSSSGPEMACAVVSDGCSSGGHTDIGARIVSLATMRAMHYKEMTVANVEIPLTSRQQNVLLQSRFLLDLDKTDLLATCVYALVTTDGVRANIQGDGAIAIKYRTGSILAYRLEWNNNTPFYPAYLSNGDLECFFAAHGGRDNISLTAEEAYFDGSAWLEKVRELTSGTGVDGYTVRLGGEMLKEVEFIAVFSDGVSQVDGMSWKEVVLDFLAMKNTTGEFVKRRLIRSIKDMRERGKGPLDDISAAMIHVTHE